MGKADERLESFFILYFLVEIGKRCVWWTAEPIWPRKEEQTEHPQGHGRQRAKTPPCSPLGWLGGVEVRAAEQDSSRLSGLGVYKRHVGELRTSANLLPVPAPCSAPTAPPHRSTKRTNPGGCAGPSDPSKEVAVLLVSQLHSPSASLLGVCVQLPFLPSRRSLPVLLHLPSPVQLSAQTLPRRRAAIPAARLFLVRSNSMNLCKDPSLPASAGCGLVPAVRSDGFCSKPCTPVTQNTNPAVSLGRSQSATYISSRSSGTAPARFCTPGSLG